MSLAFRRATKEADEAVAGYYSHFKDYYGVPAEKPIAFDWDSAKAIEGTSKHNANEEELPKCVTIAQRIAGSPNHLPSMVSNIAYKATDDQKDIAFAIMRKHVQSILVHFDAKSTKPGECTWTCEVKDGVLHATMHWNFDQYLSYEHYEDVCTWLENYLDDTEALWFEIEKARMVKDHESGSNYRYFNSDGVAFVRDTFGKDVAFEYNWDEMKKIAGKSTLYSDKPPVNNNYLAVYALNDGRAMYVVRDVLGRIGADDMGKEAFNDAFNTVRIEVQAAPKHDVSVRKDGKKLVFTFKIDFNDHQNCVRGADGGELAKKVEALL